MCKQCRQRNARFFDNRGKNKTRKGVTHRRGVPFQSRQILVVTPAQYRHQHYGLR